jgi:hypothetical protein
LIRHGLTLFSEFTSVFNFEIAEGIDLIFQFSELLFQERVDVTINGGREIIFRFSPFFS